MSDCVTLAFRKGALEHVLLSRAKIALFTSSARLSEKTTRYSSDSEVIGGGYQPGGILLVSGKITERNGECTLTFGDAVWPNITATARTALVYLADDAGRAVRVLDLGKDITSTNGPFTVYLPSADAGGIITL